MAPDSTQSTVALALATVSGIQALLTGVANSPVSWLTGHLLEHATRQQDNDELGFHKFFHNEDPDRERLPVFTEFVNLAALATTTLWSMLVSAIVLLALGFVAYQSDDGDGWMLTCGLGVIVVLVAVAVLIAKAARGQVGRYPKGKRAPQGKKLQVAVLKYWQNLWSLDTLTPYRTVALVANLFAAVVAARFG